VSVRQMRRFAERLRKEMGERREVISREVPGGHVVSGALIWSEALPFLKRCLAEPSLARGGAERLRSSQAGPGAESGEITFSASIPDGEDAARGNSLQSH